MSNNVVKHDQFKEVVQDLWTKAKKRDIEALAYDPATKTIKGTNSSNDTLSISTALTNVAVVDQENRFTQDNVFTKVYVDDVSTTLGMDIPDGGNLGHSINAQNNIRRYGNRKMSTGQKGAHVAKIVIPVSNGMQVGHNATPLTVWAVKKGATKANDVLIETPIVNSVRLQVKDGNSPLPSSITATYPRYVEHVIDRTFDEDVYFIYTFGDHGNCIAKRDLTPSEDHLCIEESTFNTASITTSRPCDKYGVHLIYMTKKVDIKDLIANGGTVKKVNNQLPDSQGNVTIGISNIENLQAELNNRVLKTDLTLEGGTAAHVDKVPKLDSNGKLHTSLIPELAITRVKAAANEGAVQGMIGDNETQIQIGDVVVLEDSGKAYMYKGQTGSSYNFTNDFLELTMGNGTVKKISGGSPDNTGNVSVSVTEGGQQDGIIMSFGTGGTSVKIATYMTTDEVNQIKALFV